MEDIAFCIQSILFILIAIVFYFSLLEYRLKHRVLLFAWASLHFIVMTIMDNTSVEVWYTVFMVITFCPFFRNYKKITVTTIVFLTAMFLTEPLTFHTIEIIIQLNITDTTRTFLSIFGGVISRLLACPLLLLCSKLLKIAYSKEGIPLKYLLGCFFVPCISIYLLYDVYSRSHLQNAMPIQQLLCVAIITLINATVFIMFIHLTERYNNEVASFRYMEQLDAFSYEHSNLVNTVASIRTANHNMTGLLLSLESSLLDSNIDAAISSIREILATTNPNQIVSKTGNHTIDSIINYKASQAAKVGITLKVYSGPLVDLNINWIDIGVILSTALDNAMDACLENDKSQKTIHISITMKYQMCMLSIKNPYSRDLIINSDGSFETTKPNKEEHGLGLDSIKRLVNKNGGEYDIEFCDRQFDLVIVIPEAPA